LIYDIYIVSLQGYLHYLNCLKAIHFTWEARHWKEVNLTATSWGIPKQHPSTTARSFKGNPDRKLDWGSWSYL